MSLHDDLTRVIEDARDHSRKNFNVVKESYGQYLARAILASDVITQVRAEAYEAAENAAANALQTWWLQETLPEDDTDSVMDVRRAIRAARQRREEQDRG